MKKETETLSLMGLQKVLGSRIIVAMTEMSDEQRVKENETTLYISKVAKQLINNADVILRADKLRAEGKLTADSNIAHVVGKPEDDAKI